MFGLRVGQVGRCFYRASKPGIRSIQQRRYTTPGPDGPLASSQQNGRKKTSGAFGMALYAIAFSTIGAAATWYTMTRNGLGFYSDEESLKAFATTDEEARRAETIINTHPLVAQLRKRPDLTESRPHLKMPKEYRQRSLTGGALTGPGYMVVPPYAWNDSKGAEMVLIGYVGSDLCGHPGIVHGGFLATMLDEALGRCSFASLPYKIAVTANLNVNYRKPTPANSFLVLRAETVKAEGRKAWMKGRIESLVEPGQTPVVYAEATALFISPKYAAMMPRILH